MYVLYNNLMSIYYNILLRRYLLEWIFQVVYKMSVKINLNGKFYD